MAKYVSILKIPAELMDDAPALESYRQFWSERSGNEAVVSRNYLNPEGEGVLRVIWDSREAATAGLGYDPGE